MADKITLDDVSSGYNLSRIQQNFDKIADLINDKLLSREAADDVANKLLDDIDMNSNQFLNTREPTADSDVVRVKDFQDLLPSIVLAAAVDEGVFSETKVSTFTEGVDYSDSTETHIFTLTEEVDFNNIVVTLSEEAAP
jgi:hypothetical protein